MLVHFSSVPRGAYGDLEKGRKKIRPAPKSLEDAVRISPHGIWADLPRTAPAPEATPAAPSEGDARAGPDEVEAPTLTKTDSDGVLIAKAFAKLDLNGDGVILEDEMAAVLIKIVPEARPTADANADGEIHYVEFASWVTREDAGAVAKDVLKLAEAASEEKKE
eukprot:g20138.t1